MIPLPLISKLCSILSPSISERVTWIVWEGRVFWTCFHPLFMFAFSYTQPSFQLGRWHLSIFVSGSRYLTTISSGEREMTPNSFPQKSYSTHGSLASYLTPLGSPCSCLVLGSEFPELELAGGTQYCKPYLNSLEGPLLQGPRIQAYIGAAHHTSQSPFYPVFNWVLSVLQGLGHLWNADLHLFCLLWYLLAIWDSWNLN